MLLSLLGFKPIIDAWFIMQGKGDVKCKGGKAMTQLTEQAVSRSIEVCFESLPQAFIQTVFIMRAPSAATTLQLASLVSSLAAVGFVMANLEYVSLLHCLSSL